MDLTQRSKSFKALSMAQPIRKDIQQTLNQLQQQKRQYLACDRQQTLLKQQLQKKRKQLNSLKKKVPQTVTDQKRTSQNDLKLKNTDRTYEKTLGNIQKLKQEIDTSRKRISKLKEYNSKLFSDRDAVTKQIDQYVEKIVERQRLNQELKQEIVTYREQNIKNLTEFRKSHMNLTKSNFKDENQRRKYAVSTKTFLGEEIKKSRLVPHNMISDILRNSGIVTNQGKSDVLAQSVPIAKARVTALIHRNKEKIKIAESYMRFGQGLESMFKIMKQYKGRDDVDYLSQQFVKKQKQIQKLGEYIGKLQYRIVTSKTTLSSKQTTQHQLQKQLSTNNSHMEIQQHYAQLSQNLQQEIKGLKNQHLKMNKWLAQIGELLCPIVGDQDFSRGNAINVIGKIQQKMSINRSGGSEKKKTGNRMDSEDSPRGSPAKGQNFGPGFDQDQTVNIKYNQLMSYDKMKEFADDYIKTKKQA